MSKGQIWREDILQSRDTFTSRNINKWRYNWYVDYIDENYINFIKKNIFKKYIQKKNIYKSKIYIEKKYRKKTYIEKK